MAWVIEYTHHTFRGYTNISLAMGIQCQLILHIAE